MNTPEHPNLTSKPEMAECSEEELAHRLMDERAQWYCADKSDRTESLDVPSKQLVQWRSQVARRRWTKRGLLAGALICAAFLPSLIEPGFLQRPSQTASEAATKSMNAPQLATSHEATERTPADNLDPRDGTGTLAFSAEHRSYAAEQSSTEGAVSRLDQSHSSPFEVVATWTGLTPVIVVDQHGAMLGAPQMILTDVVQPVSWDQLAPSTQHAIVNVMTGSEGKGEFIEL